MVILGLGFAGGLATGWNIYRTTTKAEPPAVAVRQGDGSLILERKPETQKESEKLIPTPQIPKGAKIERKVEVIVQPERKPEPLPLSSFASSVPADLAAPQKQDCPPVRVDLALVRMPDETRRVIASSQDGQIVGGVDIPLEPEKPSPRPIKWSAAGLVGWDAYRNVRVYGAAVQRNAGPFVVHGGVIGQTVFAGVGIRW